VNYKQKLSGIFTQQHYKEIKMPNIAAENSPASGRTFANGAALAAAGLAAAGLLAPKAARAVSPALTFADIPGADADTKVLNYALALEDLEADLYVQALQRLGTGGTNALGTTIPPLGIASSEIDVAYLTKFAAIEVAHRDFLKGALGANAITTLKPAKYNFGIETLDRRGVLDLVLEAEETGVQAYLGAIPSFGTKTYVATAAAILGTEARHTSVLTIVRNILFNLTTPVAPLKGDVPNAPTYDPNNPNVGTVEGRDQVLTPNQVLARVSPFIVFNGG